MKIYCKQCELLLDELGKKSRMVKILRLKLKQQEEKLQCNYGDTPTEKIKKIRA